jgi:drug/metabolite transporter (DMT)-like permease
MATDNIPLGTTAPEATSGVVATPPAAGRTTLAAFLGAVALGGTNFVAVRFSNRELDPLWGAGARFSIAAGIFAVALVALRLAVPRGRDARILVVYGTLAFGASYGLLYWGMQEVPAGIAAVVLATGPLLTLLLATAHGMERLRKRAVVGAVVVLVGSGLMFLQPGESAFGMLRLGAICLAALTAAESVVLVKRCGPEHPVAMNMVAMGIGAAALLGVSAVNGEQWDMPRDPATVVAFAYLVASSVVVFMLFLLVIRRWTASATSYIFVLMPPVTVVLGAVLGGEAITIGTVAGGLVVLAGVYAGALKGTEPHRA